MHADAFRWISVAVSIVLGLGVSRILTGAVAQFHARQRRAFHFASAIWAGSIFLQQFDFWWSLEDVPTVAPHITLALFALLLGLALLLYLAAALILPASEIDGGESLGAFFQRDGRFALPVLTAFNVIAILANFLLWSVPLASLQTGVNAAFAALPLLGFAGPRRLQNAAALGYMLLMIFAVAYLSPAAY